MENKTNKSYRIRTEINKDSNVLVNFTQEYETFELLSIKMKTENLYKLHNANYGVVVGRVQANGGFGVPNAKLSIFIEVDQDNENAELLAIYGYTDIFETNSLGNTYNLLPDEQVSDCHQKIGAFPSKRYLLDNDTYIEVFDKYYKYTTRTNNAGDYIIVGVPVGNQTLHMDLDLSDCGILSQRPRDFVYKGYNIEQFENPNQFKTATGASINFLSQYVQQTKTVYVNPLWGNNDLGETIGITRADVDVNFKFEPTCVFMGSVVSDSKSNGISKKCIPTDQMGMMDELTTGKGTIEMIRKTPSGAVEEFQIKGNELIDGNGTWCYQIPMNLDYVTTNEYGETVATDNPNIGIPTRARVRFRISLDNFEGDNDNYFAGKVLVPNNPGVVTDQKTGESVVGYDYAFGTDTNDESYRDLFWNNVYSVKQHIPRIQKSGSWRTDRFTGIKQCNFYGQNNPIPYNSIRIKLPFMFIVLCALIKTYVRIVSFLNAVINAIYEVFIAFLIILIPIIIALNPLFWIVWLIMKIIRALTFGSKPSKDKIDKVYALCTMDVKNWSMTKKLQDVSYITIADGICPDLECWYFAPCILSKGRAFCIEKNLLGVPFKICQQTIDHIASKEGIVDPNATDTKNEDTGADKICITRNIDYLMSCIEMNLAQEYKVIKFDFYNDWINGLIYIPRWKFRPSRKVTFLFGLIKFRIKEKGCFDDSSIFGQSRRLTQHCSLGYSEFNFGGGYVGYAKVATSNGCSGNKKRQKCHKNPGIRYTWIFGNRGGLVHREKTMLGQTVYYYKPSEMSNNKNGNNTKINIFATDLILLGSLNECNIDGVPQAFKLLGSSSYKMPTNLALTNLDDSGVLYVDGNSYCRGGGNSSTIENRKASEASHSFSGQVAWSSSAPAEVSIVGYGKGANSVESSVNSISDRIAITEAAGISWDYTGPAQESAENNDLFSPGGHFLGMSCINAKTNIKSCINLQRICEAGVTMSERQENVRQLIKQADETYKPLYSVLSPTGLISNDEIVGASFRNMFATLNLNPLIATRKDENTGYLKYQFTYLRSNGFEGGAKKNVISQSSKYNMRVTNAIPESFINDGLGDDYDPSESGNTFHRAIETPNLGYYRFRFGLKNADVKAFKREAATRYALKSGGAYYLPQYENSFYFYFGLKDGNTAMDRLYSDFFSMCPTRDNQDKKNMSFRDGGTDYCSRKQAVFVTTENIELPYDLVLKNGGLSISATNVTYPVVMICDLTPGEWTATVSEKDGVSISKKLRIGSNLRHISYTFEDFKENIKEGFSVGHNHRPINLTSGNPIKGGAFTFNSNSIVVFGQSLSGFYNEITGSSIYSETDKFMGLLFVGKKEGSLTNSKSSSSSYGSGSSSGFVGLNTKSDKISAAALMLMYNGNDSFSINTFKTSDFYSASTEAHVTDFEYDGSYTISAVTAQDMIDFSSSDKKIYAWDEETTYTMYFIYKCGSDSKFVALELCSFFSYGYSVFNVFVGSKYLKYNGKNKEGFTLDGFFTTSGYSYANLVAKLNGAGGSNAYITQWALRQALFDQRYDNTLESTDRVIRCTNLNGEYIDGFTFGQPEKSFTSGDTLMFSASTFGNISASLKITLSTSDYNSYVGFDIDDGASLLPTIGINEDVKLPYYKMTYDDLDEIILSKSIGKAKVSSVEEIDVAREDGTSDKFSKITVSLSNYSNGLQKGMPYVLKKEITGTTSSDDSEEEDTFITLECSCASASTSTSAIFILPTSTLESSKVAINSGDVYYIHPTLMVPVVHRPFYYECCAFFIGYFNSIGKLELEVDINVETPSEDNYWSVTGCGETLRIVPPGTGCRLLNYYLSRDDGKKNSNYAKLFMRIYGGNACGPDYNLGSNSSINGIQFTTPICIKDNVLSPSINPFIETSPHIQDLSTENIEDEISIKLSTGNPEIEKFSGFSDTEKTRILSELVAFKNIDESTTGEELNNEIQEALSFSTERTIKNYLPKEIVIRKEADQSMLDAKYKGPFKETKYLSVGDDDSITNEEVNDNVKLYLIITPDFKTKTTNVGLQDVMKTSMVPSEIYAGLYWGIVGGVYKGNITPKEVLSPITLADYFSNPSAVIYLLDQIIEGAYQYFPSKGSIFRMLFGRVWGGYFENLANDDFIKPGLTFSLTDPYDFDFWSILTNRASIYFASAIIPQNLGFYTERSASSYAGPNSVPVYRLGYPENKNFVNLEYILNGYKRKYDEHISESLTSYLNRLKLVKSVNAFGLTLGVQLKYDVKDENSFPTDKDNRDIYFNKLSESTAEYDDNPNCYRSNLETWGVFRIFKYNQFDTIIGRNWSAPNIEFMPTNSITASTVSETTVDKNLKNLSLALENERQNSVNNNVDPNYVKVLAKYFINNRFTTNADTEEDTIKQLFAKVKSDIGYESIIIPIRLGKPDTGDMSYASGAVGISVEDNTFILPSGVTFTSLKNEGIFIQKDKKWVCNAKTRYALTHISGSGVPQSTIRDAIFDENMSLGFRSVIVGVYNGDSADDVDENNTGNLIRPVKIYTFHSHGLSSSQAGRSKTTTGHSQGDLLSANEYDLQTTNGKTETTTTYYRETFENDYDDYASGWC